MEEYKTLPLYEKITTLYSSIKKGIEDLPEYKKHKVSENQSLLIGRSTFNERLVSTDFDFVIFNKKDFNWKEQKNKDEVLLVCKVIFKTSVDSMKKDIEAELFKFHSIQAVRKILVFINTQDVITKEFIPLAFMKDYDLFLNFPSNIGDNVNLDKCNVCGTVPSRIEPWFYHENSKEFLPLEEHVDDFAYFGM